MNIEPFIEANEDLMGRLLIGKATEGDQLQVHNHIEACDIYEDVYGQLCDMIEPYVQRQYSNPDGKLPASVVEGFGIVFREWLQRAELLEEVLNEVPHGWGESFSQSDLAERIRAALGG